MKTHGQNSPQTIRGMRERRSLRGLLDTRRFAESDLRDVDYVAPFGRGFHLVRNPGGTSSFIIADQTGGRTFAPHTSVLSGSSSGKPGEVLLGGAPAGKKGGISRSANRRRRGTASTAVSYYAFWSDGRAGLYLDDTFESYRATGGPTITSESGLIHTDSETLVGDGAIVCRVSDSALRVWDVENATTYNYSVPVGYVCSPAVYADGFLWWVEREEFQHGGVGAHKTYFRLCKSRTDLATDFAIVYTYEAVHALGFSVLWDPIQGISIATSGVMVQDHWLDLEAGELQDEFNVRFTRAGGSATDNGWPAISTGTNVDPWSFRVAPLTAGGIGAGGAAGFLAGQADDPETSPVAFWSGVEWGLGEFSDANPSVSADGSEGSLYDGTELVRGPAETGTPTARFTVGLSPESDVPMVMFIKG